MQTFVLVRFEPSLRFLSKIAAQAIVSKLNFYNTKIFLSLKPLYVVLLVYRHCSLTSRHQQYKICLLLNICNLLILIKPCVCIQLQEEIKKFCLEGQQGREQMLVYNTVDSGC